MSTTWARPNGHTKGNAHTCLSLVVAVVAVVAVVLVVVVVVVVVVVDTT